MKRIVILLLVITGLYIAFQQSFQLDWFSAGKQDGQAALSNDVHMIRVDVGGVNTTIIPQNRQNVKAVLEGKGKLSVNENGNAIEVSIKHKWFDWFGWSPFTKKELNVYIPENYHGNMAFNLGSGNMNFSGHSMRLDELSVDIGSGNMYLNHLEAKHFKHEGASGNVVIDSLKTESGSFDLSSGNLDLHHYTGAIKADVASGEFNVQLDNLKDSIEVDLSSGNVGLSLPADADFKLNGEVSSGNISCDIPLKSEERNHKSISGIHGSGKYKIDLSVSSGNIRIH
jgi:lia operon protein LiaG